MNPDGWSRDDLDRARALARELDAAGVRTRSGHPFNHAAVGRILAAELAPVLEARAAGQA